jgi:hypothetical protein
MVAKEDNDDTDPPDLKPKDPPVRARPDAASAVELLQRYNAGNFRGLLRGAKSKLKTTGSKDELVERVLAAIAAGQISIKAVIARLDAVQGWGNQQLYLFRAPDGLNDTWSKEASARAQVKSAGYDTLFNAPTSVLLPAKRSLVNVAWSQKRVRFVWIETRHYEEFKREEDQGEYIQKFFLKRRERGVLAFDWDLVTGRAMMMIQALPSGSDFASERASLTKQLKPMVDLSAFDSVPIATLIPKVAASGEVLRRQLKPQTKRKTVITFTSASRKADLDDDPEAAALRAPTKSMPGHLGNFYWHRQKGSPLRYAMHTTLYAGDNRIGIHAERTQVEVEHVLGRLWHYLDT